MNFLHQYILRKKFLLSVNIIAYFFLFATNHIFPFKNFFCKHLAHSFTFSRLLLYNILRTIWLLGVFFPQSIKIFLLEVRWCPMKGISNGLFNNLGCTFNSTFKNLFQKGLKTNENTYSSLNRCFLITKTFGLRNI